MTTVALDPEARRLLTLLPQLLSDEQTAQLVTIIDVQGSAPRAPGARMLCRDGRLLAGTIGGGHLEDKALRTAAELATGGDFPATVHRYRLGPELAQCCGGVVEVLFEAITRTRALTLLKSLQDAVQTATPLLTEGDGRSLRELPGELTTVVIFGGGHVGAALAAALAILPWRVIVVDGREQWANRQRFASTTEVLQYNPVAVLAAWGWLGELHDAQGTAPKLAEPAPKKNCTSAVVMTHDHSIDRDLADALLRVGERTDGEELKYVGVIGSKTKIATLRRRLSDRGAKAGQLQRLIAPIGLRVDGELLGGKLPGEIALSVAAQLLAVATTGQQQSHL